MSQNEYPHQLQPEEVHLQDYLLVLYRRRWPAFLAFLLVVAAVTVFTFWQKPVYEAKATLHVREEKARGGNLLGELGLSRENPIETEIEILKSRTNIEKVVERLHLNWVVSDNKSDLDFTVLELTSTAAESPKYLIRLTGPESFSVENDEGKTIANGRSGALVRGDGFSLLVKGLQGKEGDRFSLTLDDFGQTVRTVREAIRANEVGKGTNIIELSYLHTDPQLVREVVNALAHVYLERSTSLKTEEARKSVQFIEGQLAEVRSFLNSAEQSLEDYKRTSGVIHLDSEAQMLIQRLADADKELSALQLQMRQVEFAIQTLEDSLARGEVYAPSVLMNDPVIAALAKRLAELELERRGVLIEATGAHPLAKKLEGQMEKVQRKMLATFSAAKEALAVQTDTLKGQLHKGEEKLLKLPQAELELARLTRLATVNAGIYIFLLEKHQEARIAKAATISNVNVIDPAITPEKPVKPQKKKNLLLGLILGVMLAIGVAFLLEYLDDTVKDSDSAKRLLGLPILATIPHIGLPKGKRLHGAEVEKHRALISDTEPRAPAAEAFRSLRTSIHFSGGKAKNQVLLLVSTFPSEGKTTIAVNLAITMAKTGRKVLLVGCDLRKPTLHSVFDIPKAPGVTEILIGDCSVADALHRPGHFDLDFINAGTTPPNPAELLGSSEMSELIAQQRDRYDTIIIDAPPVLAVTDAAVLTGLADQVLTVVELGGVQVKAAQRNIEILRSVNAPIAGLVLNDKTGKGADYYSYYGYYGNDSDGYGDKPRRGLKKLFGRG